MGIKQESKAYGIFEYFLRIVPPNVMQMYEGTKVDKDISEVIPFFRLWARNAFILWIIHISLGLITTILTISITSLASVSFYTQSIPILAVFAAITAALLTSLDIGTKSNNTRNAWRKLNIAMMKYNQNLFNKEQVINAYEEGEALISGINYTPPSNDQQEKERKKEQILSNEDKL
jgi:hypothetical protein